MRRALGLALVLAAAGMARAAGGADRSAIEETVLPTGVKVVWDLDKAQQQTTATRGRVCLNGLWRFQPAEPQADKVPQGNWGYFKVPGAWPGITDYMQKDCQTVFAHPRWRDVRLASLTAAWYQRTIEVPADWSDRRIALSAEYVNSYGAVFIDGRKVGEIVFPAGEVDLTAVCRPGQRYTLSLLVVALPLRGVMLAYRDTNSARQVQGSVPRRGLCGDVYLVGGPRAERLGPVRIETSVRRGTVRFVAEVLGAAADRRFRLRATVREGQQVVLEAASLAMPLEPGDGARLAWAHPWRPERLWDIHTPQHQYEATVALLDAEGRVLDVAWPQRFGFREFWVQGRDFYLNGSRIFLSAVPLDNAQVGAAWASYAGACESLRRLKSFGINFVYTHNYDCQPGSHLSFEEILRAADDVGMLVALSQPHFAHYEWGNADAEKTNGYARHAKFYVQVAGSHPSVVMYATSHNATGYNEDMNPDLIDGIHDPRDGWSLNNARRAMRAEAIVRNLDPTRIVYHHSSGNLGAMHTSNFYPNWVPIQEMCDWFQHWASQGVKPFFTCEYGAPFTWDWAMYRGWYKGHREFGSAVVPWDFCLAEWNAQFCGDAAYRISPQEKRNLRWEAEQFRQGRLWHRWDYPHQLGSSDFDERYPILARYLTEPWRAFRALGVSAISPWEYHVYWKLRPGVARNRRVDLPTDWDKLQRPGYSPDYLEDRFERMDMAYAPEDWVATPAAQAMYRNNGPVLAYIAGKPEALTSHDHNFLPGESVAKQLVLINNSREAVDCTAKWQFVAASGRQAGDTAAGDRSAAAPCVGGPSGPTAARATGHGSLPVALAQGSARLHVETGQQDRIPVRVTLPPDLAPGTYELSAVFEFSTHPRQEDRFEVHVLPTPPAGTAAGLAGGKAKVAVFDPPGQTAQRLRQLQVNFDTVGAAADLRGYDVLVVGKSALTIDGPAPSLAAVRDGLKVVVFEQTAEVLQDRLGFRIAEYGLRHVFRRVPDHPSLAGLSEDHLRDWRGQSTLLPPRLKYQPSDKYAGAPVVRWCGMEVPRLWRCGNRGNVASVLIEKPAVGDFLPLLDGGFSLQYSPLLEYREGRGMVLFCQMDVTGRTEDDPAADQLFRNILRYVMQTKYPVVPERKAVYAGDAAGREYLQQAGIACAEYAGGEIAPDEVLIVSPGAAEKLAPQRESLTRWLNAKGRLVALELEEAEANRFLPSPMRTARREHIAAWFAPPQGVSPFAGIGPADVHNRDPRELPLVQAGAEVLADGVLASAADGRIVFCQMVPYRFVKRPRASPEFSVTEEEAAEGRASALIEMATVPWAQIGQKVPAGQPGKTYTLAAVVKPLGSPATARLEVERAGRPWDRAVRGQDQKLPADQWTELHVTFRVDKPYPEGWQAYLHVGQPEARLRADAFRLYEGPYIPFKPGQTPAPALKNLFANPGFESGSASWYFNWNTEQQNLRKTFRRSAFLLSRLLGNCGVRATTPLLERFSSPLRRATGPSLVKNGDFTADENRDGVPDGWVLASESKQARCELEASGPAGHCVRITSPHSAGQRRGGAMLAQHNLPMRQGQWYRLSFQAKAKGLTARQVLVAVQETVRWQPILDYQRFAPGEEWKEFTFVLPAKASADANRLQVWFEGAGTLWLSGLSLAPCEPPTAGRWLEGFYLDKPQEWDDPYRFFRW